MRREELIDTLSADLKPVGPYAVERRVMAGLAVGMAAGLALLVVWLGLRPDLVEAVRTGMFWIKLAYTLAIGVTAMILACGLARPDCPARASLIVALAPLGVVAIWAAAEIVQAPGADRLRLWLGSSWMVCPLRIMVISAPAFFGALWAFRRFAPTRLRLAGFAAGLAAGGAGASVYALACQESTVAFLATWYTLGVLAVAGLGALVGPRVLRW